MTAIDLEGFKEKVYRRTKSQTTVDTYLRAIDKFEKFSKDRYHLNRSNHLSRGIPCFALYTSFTRRVDPRPRFFEIEVGYLKANNA